MPTKGRTLRVQRVRVGVTQTALAARMQELGFLPRGHRNTIVSWEKQAEVPSEDAKAYLAALETFRESDENVA